MGFSSGLAQKISRLKARRTPLQIGRLSFASSLIQAPMAAICHAPYRLLMEDLGAGGTVSELISVHAIAHQNKKTMHMLLIDPREKNVGIQLFGEDPKLILKAAKVCERLPIPPKFIDINMGCPVSKVVHKGAGAALLKTPQELKPFLTEIKQELSLPLTIKIRTGWDAHSINAQEVVQIAQEVGIEFVTIHGRTRAQQYTGNADWNLIDSVAKNCALPIIGNGDLHTPHAILAKKQTTHCQALMVARGSIRNPFIFLESELFADEEDSFTATDYLEVLHVFAGYINDHFHQDQIKTIQLKKHAAWFAQGFPFVAQFRQKVFTAESFDHLLKLCDEFFLSIKSEFQKIDHAQNFMSSGHG